MGGGEGGINFLGVGELRLSASLTMNLIQMNILRMRVSQVRTELS